MKKLQPPAAPNQPPPLTRIVPWSHQFLQEILSPGDLAVDLTAGKGRDTLVLAEAVGPQGQVVAFDVQAQALEQVEASLREHGITCRRLAKGEVLPEYPGVFLVQACHASLAEVVPGSIKGAIANLGYLPGGDLAIITRPETTRAALQTVLNKLVPGGRLAVAVYPGHAGGAEEGTAVEKLLTELPAARWRVLRLAVTNRPEAPCLLVAERHT